MLNAVQRERLAAVRSLPQVLLRQEEGLTAARGKTQTALAGLPVLHGGQMLESSQDNRLLQGLPLLSLQQWQGLNCKAPQPQGHRLKALQGLPLLLLHQNKGLREAHCTCLEALQAGRYQYTKAGQGHPLKARQGHPLRSPRTERLSALYGQQRKAVQVRVRVHVRRLREVLLQCDPVRNEKGMALCSPMHVSRTP